MTPLPLADKRVSWIALAVLLLCFVLVVASRGASESFAVFLLPLGVEFGWGRSELTSIYTALMISFAIASPLAGIIFDRFGARVVYGLGILMLALGYGLAGQISVLWQFYLCIGVIGGIGAAFVGLVPASALIGRWFRNRLTTAMGFTSAGLGFGGLIVAPSAQIMIDASGWRFGYFALSLVFIGLLPIVLLLPWRRIEAGPANNQAPESRLRPPTLSFRQLFVTLFEATKVRTFWALVLVYILTGFAVYTIVLQSVAYLVDYGFNPIEAAGAFGLTGMMTCVGMVVTGYAADRFGNLITATTSYAVTALGVFCLMMVQFWPSWVMVGGYILAVGGTLGVRSPMIQAIASRRFAGPGFGVIFGAVSIGQGLGAGGGALIAGYLHDLTGSYTANFLWSFVSVAAAVMVFWMFPELQDNPADRRRRAKSQRRLPEEKNND